MPLFPHSTVHLRLPLLPDEVLRKLNRNIQQSRRRFIENDNALHGTIHGMDFQVRRPVKGSVCIAYGRVQPDEGGSLVIVSVRLFENNGVTIGLQVLWILFLFMVGANYLLVVPGLVVWSLLQAHILFGIAVALGYLFLLLCLLFLPYIVWVLGYPVGKRKILVALEHVFRTETR